MANSGTKTYLSGKMGEKVVIPETRRGSPYVFGRKAEQKDGASYWNEFVNLQEDENFNMIKDRIQHFSDKTRDGLGNLRNAIDAGDSDRIVLLAKELTDYTGRMGALKMMKLCIALQMLGRRDMIAGADRIVYDLESEFERLRDSYVCAV